MASDGSAVIGATLSPVLCAAFSEFSDRRQVMKTQVAPSSTMHLVVVKPMSSLAPVTSATLFKSSPMVWNQCDLLVLLIYIFVNNYIYGACLYSEVSDLLS